MTEYIKDKVDYYIYLKITEYEPDTRKYEISRTPEHIVYRYKWIIMRQLLYGHYEKKEYIKKIF